MKYIIPHTPKMSYKNRCERYRQNGAIIWFTGLSGSGKTTLTTSLEHSLIQASKIVCLLDGDTLRVGLNSDLGFDQVGRKENIRRIGELAIYLAQQAFIVLVSAISPHKLMRQEIRFKAESANIIFTEVYVKASIETCRQRNPKGLYDAIEEGKIKNFTGIDSLYEPPDFAEIILDTEQNNLETCLNILISHLNSSVMHRF